MTDVFVLGAGFSCAVSSEMPTTNALGEMIADNLAADPRFASVLSPTGTLPDPDVERWLSRLAERHPFDDFVTRQHNQAVFAAVSRIIARCVRTAESLALTAEPPGWLLHLVGTWRECRSTVLTFNYDTIVETTFNLLTGESEFAHSLLPPGGVRTWRPLWAAPGSSDGMALCKLHGSVNWYWQPEGFDRGVFDIGVGEKWPPGPPVFDTDEVRFRSAGGEPFIVPPTSLKGPFFQHDTLRLHWTTAADALNRASTVFVLGYSLPQTDLVAGNLFVSSLLNHVVTRPRVVVVNTEPDGVVERLRSLTRGGVEIESGPTSIEDFAWEYRCDETSPD